MKRGEYDCPECGRLADEGQVSYDGINRVGFYLRLSCPNGMDPSWTVIPPDCEKCGKIPSYGVRHAGEWVPILLCCTIERIPNGYGPNPFYEEVAI